MHSSNQRGNHGGHVGLKAQRDLQVCSFLCDRGRLQGGVGKPEHARDAGPITRLAGRFLGGQDHARQIDGCPQWFLSSPCFGFVGKIQTQVHFILFAQINNPDSGTCLQQVLEGIHLGVGVYRLLLWQKPRR